MTFSRGDAVIYRNERGSVLAEVVYAGASKRDIRIAWHDGNGRRTSIVWASKLRKPEPRPAPPPPPREVSEANLTRLAKRR